MMYYYKCLDCGDKAFYILKKPQDGDLILASDARHLDGSKVEPGSLIHCESCGILIKYLLTSRVVEAADEVPQGEDQA